MGEANFAKNPAAESCRRIDFDNVVVRPGFVKDTFFLTVSGTTPCINMKVSLSPMIYIRCPEYWEIEVVGCLPGGICLEAIGHFEETISLTGVTGSKGIEVVGATKKDRHDVRCGCSSNFEFVKR